MNHTPITKNASFNSLLGLIFLAGLPAFASEYYVGAKCMIDPNRSTPLNTNDQITLKQNTAVTDYGLDLISTEEIDIPAFGTFTTSAISVQNVTLLSFTHQSSPSTVAILQIDDSPGKVNRRGKFKGQLIIANAGAANPLVGSFVGNTLFYRLQCKAQN